CPFYTIAKPEQVEDEPIHREFFGLHFFHHFFYLRLAAVTKARHKIAQRPARRQWLTPRKRRIIFHDLIQILPENHVKGQLAAYKSSLQHIFVGEANIDISFAGIVEENTISIGGN